MEAVTRGRRGTTSLTNKPTRQRSAVSQLHLWQCRAPLAFVLHHGQRDQEVRAAVVLKKTRPVSSGRRAVKQVTTRASISSMDAVMPYTSCGLHSACCGTVAAPCAGERTWKACEKARLCSLFASTPTARMSVPSTSVWAGERIESRDLTSCTRSAEGPGV